MAAVVIVTRPSDSGRRLCGRLVDLGHRAVWWPAFDIGDAPDTALADAVIARLAEYDLAVFVSATAVRSVKFLMRDKWPASTLIGAVGAATRAAIEAELRPDLAVIAPDADDESGSESFWATWQASGRSARRVLLLRAEAGRDWLGERFAESGADVNAIAVYSRRPRAMSADDRTQLNEWATQREVPIIVFSSSEAIAALDQQAGPESQRWLRSGTAIAGHPRIAHRLLAEGYSRVVNATFDDDSIIAKLESIGS